MKPAICIAALLLAGTAQAGRWTARSSSGYTGDDGRGGRFDLRVRVNGPTTCEIRNIFVECRSSGMDPRDAGSEATAPIPRGRIIGLRSEQRDGRSRMTIEDSGNGYLRVRIDDRQKGDDGRHHLRITWEDSGGWGGSGGSGGNWGGSGGNWGGSGGNWGGSGGNWGWGGGNDWGGSWRPPNGWNDIGSSGWGNNGWNDWDNGNHNVPGWAIGEFSSVGSSPAFRDIRIGRGGRAAVRYPNGDVRRAEVRDGWLRVEGGNMFQMRRGGPGIELRNQNGRTFDFRRN